MLVVAALSAIVAPPPHPKLRSVATAIVRIERPVAAGAGQWEASPAHLRREVVRVDENGRPVLLRLVEMP
jgi:hypothetical protein